MLTVTFLLFLFIDLKQDGMQREEPRLNKETKRLHKPGEIKPSHKDHVRAEITINEWGIGGRDKGTEGGTGCFTAASHQGGAGRCVTYLKPSRP